MHLGQEEDGEGSRRRMKRTIENEEIKTGCWLNKEVEIKKKKTKDRDTKEEIQKQEEQEEEVDEEGGKEGAERGRGDHVPIEYILREGGKGKKNEDYKKRVVQF